MLHEAMIFILRIIFIAETMKYSVGNKEVRALKMWILGVRIRCLG